MSFIVSCWCDCMSWYVLIEVTMSLKKKCHMQSSISSVSFPAAVRTWGKMIRSKLRVYKFRNKWVLVNSTCWLVIITWKVANKSQLYDSIILCPLTTVSTFCTITLRYSPLSGDSSSFPIGKPWQLQLFQLSLLPVEEICPHLYVRLTSFHSTKGMSTAHVMYLYVEWRYMSTRLLRPHNEYPFSSSSTTTTL